MQNWHFEYENLTFAQGLRLESEVGSSVPERSRDLTPKVGLTQHVLQRREIAQIVKMSVVTKGKTFWITPYWHW
jgi:hypothetical protein